MAHLQKKIKYMKLGRLICDIGAVVCWVITLFPLLAYWMALAKGQDIGYAYHFTVNPVLIMAVGFSLADLVWGYYILQAQKPREKKVYPHKKRRKKR